MDQTALQRIFEPFFSTKGIGGSGLGLWITQELVEKNHGSIRIRSSTRQGRSGTVVTMFSRIAAICLRLTMRSEVEQALTS